MSKDTLKKRIELVPDEDIETLYKKIIPETEALPDEIEALKEAKQDIIDNGTVSHDSINWD